MPCLLRSGPRDYPAGYQLATASRPLQSSQSIDDANAHHRHTICTDWACDCKITESWICRFQHLVQRWLEDTRAADFQRRQNQNLKVLKRTPCLLFYERNLPCQNILSANAAATRLHPSQRVEGAIDLALRHITSARAQLRLTCKGWQVEARRHAASSQVSVHGMSTRKWPKSKPSLGLTVKLTKVPNPVSRIGKSPERNMLPLNSWAWPSQRVPFAPNARKA